MTLMLGGAFSVLGMGVVDSPDVPGRVTPIGAFMGAWLGSLRGGVLAAGAVLLWPTVLFIALPWAKPLADDGERAAMKAVALSPLPFVAPLGVLCGCMVLGAMERAGVVTRWPVVLDAVAAVGSSCWWLPGLLVVWWVYAVWGAHAAKRLALRVERCRGCGYDLRGSLLASEACPECGWPIPKWLRREAARESTM